MRQKNMVEADYRYDLSPARNSEASALIRGENDDREGPANLFRKVYAATHAFDGDPCSRRLMW